MSKNFMLSNKDDALLKKYLSRLIKKAPDTLFPENMTADEVMPYFVSAMVIKENKGDESTRSSDIKNINKAIKAIDTLIDYFDHSTKKMSSIAFDTLIVYEKDWIISASKQRQNINKDNLTTPILDEYSGFLHALKIKQKSLLSIQKWLKANKSYTNTQYRNHMLTELANQLVNTHNYPVEKARLCSAEIFAYFGVNIPTLNASWQEYGEENADNQKRILRDLMKTVRYTPKTQKS